MARLATICLVALVAACDGPPPAPAELSGQTMGTRYSIKVFPAPAADLQSTLQRLIEQRLDEINGQMSTYLPDSALSRFNHSQSTEWQEVPAGLSGLVERANAISLQSKGRYDVTVGPLVDLWGFGSAGRRENPPSDAEIAERLQYVGYRHLHARQSPPSLRKTLPGLQVDLSSIAKGWAVDELARLLEAQGIENYLVEIGGELRARGDKGPLGAWQVAIESPLAGRRQVQHVIAVHDLAVATSGDYRNFFESGGQRYSHTIDPLTGRTMRHMLASVTTIADNCTDADAWATALMALGDRAGPETADRLGLKALFIVRTDTGFIEILSEALRADGQLQPPG